MRHRWGDEWFQKYGPDLYEAERWLEKNARRWGRLGGQIKEKWGRLQFYVTFHWQLHDLVYPGYCYIQWNRVFRWIDDLYQTEVFNWPRQLIVHYQQWVYKILYRRLVAKWPHIADEVAASAQWPEYLDTNVAKIHWKYWKRV